MNFVRSAIAPETIVAAVAQNTKLNTNSAHLLKSESWVRTSRFGTPISPKNVSSPSIRPKPRSTNAIVPRQKSIKFFIIMLPAFFALVKPVSTIAKPHCIKNTNAAPIRYHIPLPSPTLNIVALTVS